MIGMHLQQAPHPFLLALYGVVYRVARTHHPRIHPEKGQMAHERVRHDLDGQGLSKARHLGARARSDGITESLAAAPTDLVDAMLARTDRKSKRLNSSH